MDYIKGNGEHQQKFNLLRIYSNKDKYVELECFNAALAIYNDCCNGFGSNWSTQWNYLNNHLQDVAGNQIDVLYQYSFGQSTKSTIPAYSLDELMNIVLEKIPIENNELIISKLTPSTECCEDAKYSITQEKEVFIDDTEGETKGRLSLDDFEDDGEDDEL